MSDEEAAGDAFGGFHPIDLNFQAMERLIVRTFACEPGEQRRQWRKWHIRMLNRNRTKLGKQRSARGKSADYWNGRKP